MKRIFIAAIAVAILVLGWVALDSYLEGRNASANIETEAAQTGNLRIVVEAPGVVRSNQSALLEWKTSGSIEQVNTSLGEQVFAGDILASLEQTTLPQSIILAQADLVGAQRTLDNLLTSQVQSAQAWQEAEVARQALEDARDPALIQSRSQSALAEAQKALEDAERNYKIIAKPPNQDGIDQAYANLLLAEKRLNNTLKQLDRVRRRATKPEDKLMFFESRELYKRILEGLELKEVQDRRAYEDSLSRYNRLVEPPNPNDLAVAEAELNRAQAQLGQAQIDWERDKDGASPAEIAVLEARLSDAQREWERWKDGPDAGEITAAEARITAAQAAIDLVQVNAPFDGIITGVFAKPGDQVAEGDQVFRLDDLFRMLVDANVSEIDINKLKAGQVAIITFDSIPDREYHGVVVEVPQVGDVLQGVSSFKIVVEIIDADEFIRPEMTATVNVVIDEIVETLLVPNQALRLRDGDRVIYVLRNGEITPLILALGAGSETYTQVISGDLQVGDQIVLNPPSSSEGRDNRSQ